jgi:hypothetical protein
MSQHHHRSPSGKIHRHVHGHRRTEGIVVDERGRRRRHAQPEWVCLVLLASSHPNIDVPDIASDIGFPLDVEPRIAEEGVWIIVAVVDDIRRESVVTYHRPTSAAAAAASKWFVYCGIVDVAETATCEEAIVAEGTERVLDRGRRRRGLPFVDG